MALTISCSSKSRLVLAFLVLPFWYLLTRVDPDIFQTSSKTVVCVCDKVHKMCTLSERCQTGASNWTGRWGRNLCIYFALTLNGGKVPQRDRWSSFTSSNAFSPSMISLELKHLKWQKRSFSPFFGLNLHVVFTITALTKQVWSTQLSKAKEGIVEYLISLVKQRNVKSVSCQYGRN